MRAGDLVRYVDNSNREKVGILVNDTTERLAADIIPIESVLTISALVLGPLTLSSLPSCRVAGGPPYWAPEPD